MPGARIEDFTRKSVAIALAGIYDLRKHRDEVLAPVLRQWDVFGRRRASTPTARRPARSSPPILDGLDSAASRFEEKRDARAAKLAARA